LRGVLTQTPHRTRTFLATVFLKFDTKPMYPIPFSPPLLVSSVRRCRETFGNATSSLWGYLRLDGEALSDSMAWEETFLLSYFSIVLLSRRNLCAKTYCCGERSVIEGALQEARPVRESTRVRRLRLAAASVEQIYLSRSDGIGQGNSGAANTVLRPRRSPTSAPGSTRRPQTC
jgi:hypothetical protein